jgi:uncharacterized protein
MPLAGKRPPLHKAAIEGDLEAARTLIGEGVAVDSSDGLGFTPIMTAVNLSFLPKNHHKMANGIEDLNHRRTDVMKLLISAGADVNRIGPGGETPLIQAGNNFEMVRCLVEAGAQVNYQSPRTGITPLMAAAIAGNLQAVRHLVESGADRKKESLSSNDQGVRMTALSYARFRNFDAVVQYLEGLEPEREV